MKHSSDYCNNTKDCHYIKTLPGLLFFVSLFFISFSVSAQTSAKIGGTILSKEGAPLSGASITVKGTSIGTSTDTSGKFSINATAGQRLVVSMVGYQTSEVEVSSQSPLVIRLVSNPNSLDDIVVIGYGTRKKGALTGAVSTVSSTEIVTTKN
ncbi:MAG TPA: carboxypeptidase-like regulatory domain-containing protein, partial [Flavitalea sp.]|nr:carboxypeptidase-like regulatory domain-containing protein [Flavitalea sp.]